MKVDKKLNNLTGIYCIINTINNKKYIGSSINIGRRLNTHKRQLINKIHKNPLLQNSVNKYGLENFYINLLEICNKDILREREQYYIDFFNSEYNLVKEVLEHFSIGKPIHMYSLEGKYIKSYDYIIDACKENNIHQSTICRYLKGTYKKGGGYLWSLVKEDSIPPYKKEKRQLKSLYQKVILENIITNETKEFESLKQCAQYLDLFPSEISKAIKTKRLFNKTFLIHKLP